MTHSRPTPNELTTIDRLPHSKCHSDRRARLSAGADQAKGHVPPSPDDGRRAATLRNEPSATRFPR